MVARATIESLLPEGAEARRRRASGVPAVLAVLVAALVMVPIAPADDDGDDDGNGCVSAPAGLVSWWPGDAHYMDIADGNHGTPVGGTGFGTGKVGPAFSFDGATGAVRALETGSNLDGFGQLTLDAWINPSRLSTGVGQLQGIVTKYDTTTTDGVSYYLTEELGGRLSLFVLDTWPGAAYGYYTSLAPVIAPNTWTHVAGVWNGGFTQSNFHLYVNGTEVPGALVTVGMPAGMADNTEAVNIGRFESSSSTLGQPFGHFQGQIDEVEIFNRALSEADIDSIVAADTAGKCKPGDDGDGDDDDDDDDSDDGVRTTTTTTTRTKTRTTTTSPA